MCMAWAFYLFCVVWFRELLCLFSEDMLRPVWLYCVSCGVLFCGLVGFVLGGFCVCVGWGFYLFYVGVV